MTGTEFTAAVAQLQDANGLSDSQVASALAGILIVLCERNDEDPVRYVGWAVAETQKLSSEEPLAGRAS